MDSKIDFLRKNITSLECARNAKMRYLTVENLRMNKYDKPKLKKGQAFCEGCGVICIDWSIKPVLLGGQFFDVCKNCQSLYSEGKLVPLCYKNH